MSTTNRQGQTGAKGSRSEPFVDTLARVFKVGKQLTADKNGRQSFRLELESLAPQSRATLTALLNMGRDAGGPRQPGRASVGTATGPLNAYSLCDDQTLSRQYLERGFAAACASNLDLDAPATTDKVEAVSVYERAWARFGRELAGSEPKDWRWFASRSDRHGDLERLYVRRGDNAWWSFGSALDRPLREQVNVDLKRSRDAKVGASGPGLDSLVTYQASRERRALRRALRAVHARLGYIGANGALQARNA